MFIGLRCNDPLAPSERHLRATGCRFYEAQAVNAMLIYKHCAPDGARRLRTCVETRGTALPGAGFNSTDPVVNPILQLAGRQQVAEVGGVASHQNVATGDGLRRDEHIGVTPLGFKSLFELCGDYE